jgi:mono/diheme cytochrome c family protein
LTTLTPNDVMRGTQVLVCLLLAGTLTFARQDNPWQGKRNSDLYADLAKAPEKARTQRNPLHNNADATAAGRKLFQMHCAECHGNAAEGTRKGPSLRTEEVRHATPGTLFWVLTNGVVRRGMPVWSKLPEPQRWQIVTYLESLEASDSQSVRQPR